MTTESIVDSIDANYAPLSVNAKQEIADLIDQLVASALEEAAARCCENCNWIQMNCILKCKYYKAILKPLNKEME